MLATNGPDAEREYNATPDNELSGSAGKRRAKDYGIHEKTNQLRRISGFPARNFSKAVESVLGYQRRYLVQSGRHE